MDDDSPFNFGNSPLGDFIKKMSGMSGPKIIVENEVKLTGAVLKLLDDYRAKKLEIIEIINKAQRLKKQSELIVDEIWEHSASLFGYQSQAALQQANRFMTMDDSSGKVILKKAEMPEEK